MLLSYEEDDADVHYFRYSKVRMLASIMSYETPKVVTVQNPSIGLLRQFRQQSGDTLYIFMRNLLNLTMDDAPCQLQHTQKEITTWF